VALALLLLLLQAATDESRTPSERYEGRALLLRTYLGLPAVDARGRRPFRPDAVLARHLVPSVGPAPRAGELVCGETGEAAWSERAAGEDGRLEGCAWAFARVESETSRVVLARLEGAATLFVNGAPFAGDLYGYGFGGVPVALREGTNELYVSGVRGAFRLGLEPCEEGVGFGSWDLTVPSHAPGAPCAWLAGILLVNASERPAEVTLEAVETPGGPVLARAEARLVSLGVRKVALRPALLDSPSSERRPERCCGAEGSHALTLRLREAGRTGERTLVLSYPVRAPGEVALRTFLSELDESVQTYATRGPAPGRSRDAPLRMLLTLHGAGVDSGAQAGSYAPKPDFWIVAPTNRRPFGFDWQDWGRRDAYEALEHASAVASLDGPVFLSGHSMGGHGTWHLAANDSDRFLALAPSAGWRSFDSYGGRPEGELAALWQAADAASRTEGLLTNLAALPTYVLHGEADDNVPASEGHAMIAALEEAGGKPLGHFEPGAGHWWDDANGPGAACLDWPGFFELFRSLPAAPMAPAVIDWTSVDPSVDARHHWVGVEQPVTYGAPLRVRGRYRAEDARLVLTTENVRRLTLSRPRGWGPELGIEGVVLDGQAFPADFGADYLRLGERWSVIPRALPAGEKSAWRSGPLKRAFQNRFVLVVPTRGSAEENAASLARARHDAEVWWYRGNGDARILEDESYLAAGPPRETVHGGPGSANVILYGNADTNAAFALIPRDYALELRRGRVRLGERILEGQALGVVALGPVGDVLFALLGSSGPEADRAAASLSLFVSGVGYPDYVVYGPEVLARGDGGVLAAGFFDHRWRLPEVPVAGR
jgi:dienelactone hydrolase